MDWKKVLKIGVAVIGILLGGCEIFTNGKDLYDEVKKAPEEDKEEETPVEETNNEEV